MFQQFTNYLLGSILNQDTQQEASSTETEGVENDNTRLTSAETEDEWILVDREDSEGNSDVSSVVSLHFDDDLEDDDILVVEKSPDRVVVVNTSHLPVPALLTRTNQHVSSSLPRASVMEESWFLTPPPCFISTGPIHMETSPLENLLIEHPSMSVYSFHGRRSTPLRFASPEPDNDDSEIRRNDSNPLSELIRGIEREHSEIVPRYPDVDIILHRALRGRGNRVTHTFEQQELQTVQSKKAQKVQVNKAYKSLSRGCLDRNNKAREVNCRNRRQRRGERSQGAKRSFANNNRKC